MAALLQGMAGFGFALLAVPLLSIILPLNQVVPLVVACSLCTNIMVLASCRQHVNLKEISIMILFGILGIPVGTYGLTHLPLQVLEIGMSILIIISALVLYRGYKITFRKKFVAYGIAGTLSGLLNGAMAMSGPPIVLFLSNEGQDKEQFKANLSFYAMITNIITLTTYTLRGLMNKETYLLLGGNLLALFLGAILGIFIAKRIPSPVFKKLVIVLLLILGMIKLL